MKESTDPATRATIHRAGRTPIRRERLDELMARATERRVTLVVAGPGHGKSHLAMALVERSPVPARLVHLAERHRDPAALAGALDLPAAAHALVVVDRLEAIGGSPAAAWLADRLHEAPGGQRFVLLGRRRPALPLARLRAAGEVAELDPGELRFDEAEVAALLRTELARPALRAARVPAVGPDDAALRDLAAGIRSLTGGWPLAVGMAATAARGDGDRAERIVDELAPELAPYLEDEVLGPLPLDVRSAVLCAGLLERLGPDALAAVAEVGRPAAADAIATLRAAGLLAPVDPDGAGERCLHVAARALARLHEDDPGTARRRHAAASRALEDDDPVAAARHLVAAGAQERVPAHVRRHLATILDRGEAGDALRLLTVAERDSLAGSILEAHAALRSASYGAAAAHAREALRRLEAGAPDPGARDRAAYDPAASDPIGPEAVVVEAIHLVGAVTADPELVAAARALAVHRGLVVPDGSSAGTAEPGAADPTPAGPTAALPSFRRARGLARAVADRFVRGAHDGLGDAAAHAAGLLDRVGSPREAALARIGGASADAAVGRGDHAAAALERALAGAPGDPAVLLALAEFHEWHGDPDTALALRAEAADGGARAGGNGAGSPVDPATTLSPSLDPYGMPRAAALAALRAAVDGEADAPTAARRAAALAVSTGSPLWEAVARVVERLALPVGSATRLVGPFGPGGVPAGAPSAVPAPLLAALVAPLLAARIDELDRATREIVDRSIAAYPDRWRPILRSRLRTAPPERRAGAERGLVAVGTHEDLDLILEPGRGGRRSAARRAHAKALARRLAPRIRLDDLGRVRLAIGSVIRPGTTVRRRVLALVCFLATRPDLSAAREQVLDALWPELEPELAANSLNQTVYFLRRTLEDPYADDRSPDYVHHDSDVVWLDPSLVTSRSRTCVELIGRARHGRDERIVDELAETYAGRFALDFAYEPWAEHHRESLHAGYLATIEGAIALAIERGETLRAVSLARRALEVDPTAEGIELGLLRLYRASGAHAAAAEQYAHYASVLRDELGVEPPPLEAL